MSAQQAKSNGQSSNRASELLVQHAQAMKAGDYVRAAAALQQIIQEQAPPAPSEFEARWVSVASCPNLLIDQPPKQNWLLTRWGERRDIGVLPRGKAGMITGTGGTGKTYAIMQLALAVATAGFWLETFRVTAPGHVLLAVAEEDLEEATRRLWRAANALGLSTEQRREAAERIHLLPLHGVPVALTCSPAPGVIAETEAAGELRKRIEAHGVDWSLIIFDPLSRWAGGGVEGDNEAATRFCQAVEKFTTVRGNPAVLVAHHSSKVSAKDGASDARGVTGIRDGFRWQATMDAVQDGEAGLEGVLFRNRKSNYSALFPDLVLARNAEPGIEGTLRLASEDEAQTLGSKQGADRLSDDDYVERVLETVRRRSGLRTPSAIAELTRGTRTKVLDAVKLARRDGLLVLASDGFEVRASEESNS